MAKGKHEAPSKRRISASITHSRRRPISAPASRRRRRSGVKLLPLAAALVLIIGVAAGSTMAYLTDESAALSGSYTAGVVDCEVQSDYSVENTGNVAAYVRVTLVQNYVDGAGNVCSAHEDITPANPAGWVYLDGFYYYTRILAPGSATVLRPLPICTKPMTAAQSKQRSMHRSFRPSLPMRSPMHGTIAPQHKEGSY